MFLLGGPAFSGKTLLAYLLNQDGIVCLDEPDFHDPEQSHRGIPVLEELFPDKKFPMPPERKLTYPEAVRLLRECQEIVSPSLLGMKTANWIFIDYARIYKKLGHQVIAMIRDIRDAMVEAPLPPWVTEKSLNAAYRMIWKNLKLYDLCLRYEDLVTKPEEVMSQISTTLRHPVRLKYTWSAESVPSVMLKLERHDMLNEGVIKTGRVGIWKTREKTWSRSTDKTAAMMGYGG